MDYIKYIKENTIRCKAEHRGGGIEIGLDKLLGRDKGYKMGYKMTAYQNYLGGGMLGKICHSYNFNPNELSKAKQKKVDLITDSLKRYFHDLTNHDDEWESESFEHNQLAKAISAY